MICCEFEEVWSTSAALERVPLVCRKMPPTDEHVVDEQRVDVEQVGDASSVGSERERQREEHGIDEKKIVTLQTTAATNCNCGTRCQRRRRRRDSRQ